MRTLLALLLTAAFVAPPKPRATVQVYPVGSVVRLKWTIAATGNPDSTTVDVSGPAPAPLHKRYVVLNKVDSLDFARPADGDSIGGTVGATSWKAGKFGVAAPKDWGWREPAAPPAPGVTVQVTPISATVAPGGTVQFTATQS